jgi:extracellular factor (EF) 3-hydroxypalmitic acid methyl ester biosynthesis protein
VAAALTRLLYGLLKPGGRLLLGNLSESAESTWFMDYVLDWRLLYRTEPELLDLATGLAPAPSESGVLQDAGKCLFLDIRRSYES